MRLTLILLLLATSCKSQTLSVQTDYFTRKDLASFVVDTPDPQKEEPIYGQRLHIHWNLSKQEFSQGPVVLAIQVALKKGDMLEENIPLKKASGTYIFPIVGSNYTEKGGILSYQVRLLSNEKALATNRHKFWIDKIEFSE